MQHREDKILLQKTHSSFIRSFREKKYEGDFILFIFSVLIPTHTRYRLKVPSYEKLYSNSIIVINNC